MNRSKQLDLELLELQQIRTIASRISLLLENSVSVSKIRHLIDSGKLELPDTESADLYIEFLKGRGYNSEAEAFEINYKQITRITERR